MFATEHVRRRHRENRHRSSTRRPRWTSSCVLRGRLCCGGASRCQRI